VRIPPCWRINSEARSPSEISIALGRGVGWGDGTHETTQLCLQAIATYRPRRPFRMLDFGSGSGILSIAGARVGATVEAVEIDEAAIAHASHNAQVNGVNLEMHRHIPDGPQCELVVANIVRAVLVEFAGALVARLGGTLILSGLLGTDVPEVSLRYRSLLGAPPERFERGEWRALVWRR
jgi:ribosomal protein L11 methyltransferase